MSVIRYGADVPSFVRKFRDAHELTQEALGERLGVHAQYVSNVERGTHENPIMFCLLLMGIVGRKRERYLMDLMRESASLHVLKLVKKKKLGSKNK